MSKAFRPQPKTLFLIDAVGACLSWASLLAMSSRYLNAWVGLAPAVLFRLAVLATLFAMYSWLCYFLLKKNHPIFLQVIALANSTYACLTLAIVIFYAEGLTWLGWGYFLAEIAVLCILSFVEWQVASQAK